MRLVFQVAAFKPEATLDLGDQSFSNFYLKAFEIKATGLVEKASACSMLICYVKEFKESFVNNVEKTTKLMIPLLRFYFHEAVESLLHLLDYAKLRDDDYVRQMKKYMNKELFKGIEIEPDHVVV
ncbi:unnamed protein product [Rotaria socialis]|uniref:Uncharacterized protein n=1 Tax=Rotaria socialis TaxID=392032 RepID=A0A820GRE1_9BILA|nr:unnamed protein product [Rotaria socialis]